MLTEVVTPVVMQYVVQYCMLFIKYLCLFPETVGAEQPSFSGVSGVSSAERSHLQTQQNLGGKSSASCTTKTISAGAPFSNKCVNWPLIIMVTTIRISTGKKCWQSQDKYM